MHNFRVFWFCSKKVEKNPIQVWNLENFSSKTPTRRGLFVKKKLLRIFLLKVFYKGFPCKFYKGIPYKKFYKGFPYKMNREKIPKPALVLHVLCLKRKKERKLIKKERKKEGVLFVKWSEWLKWVKWVRILRKKGRKKGVLYSSPTLPRPPALLVGMMNDEWRNEWMNDEEKKVLLFCWNFAHWKYI